MEKSKGIQMGKKGNSKVFSLSEFYRSLTLIELNKKANYFEKKYRSVNEMAVRCILHALDLKDHYTFGHSTRVAYYSVLVGKEIGLNEHELYRLELAALFHDIGKIGIPDETLLKPTRLNQEEFNIMKTHPEKSGELLEKFDDFEDIAKAARHHHERYDGRGYPGGLKGEEIPLYSRIILISDTFDAMTSSRVYRKALGYETAFSELREFSGEQFDPELVEHFIAAIQKMEAQKDKTFTLTLIEGKFNKNAA